MPGVSIIIISHNKPVYVKAAIQSVLDQTYTDWQAVVIDSGLLYNQGFFNYLTDSRITVIPSGETLELVKSRNISSWCINQVLNSGRLKGELFMYLCDDDLLYPAAFATFWEFYTSRNREPQAMYASQDIAIEERDGKIRIVGQRIADRPAGKFCKGRKLVCKVDYLQFCATLKILEKFREAYGTTEYQSESRADATCADGLLMENIGALTTIHPINKVISMNRRTPVSAYTFYASGRLGWLMINLVGRWNGLKQRLARAVGRN